MSADLTTVFASLQQHHIATPSYPLPECRPGVAWIWAANGIFKRGIDATLDILICVQPTRCVPGLAQLVPHVQFRTHEGRIPGQLLGAIFDHARQAGDGGAISRPVEQQYFITWRADQPRPFRVALPRQETTATRVRYEMTVQGQVLVDIHSHHAMNAYFSSTDDRDDSGLSISAVVGQIFDRSEVCVRANVYGHHAALPALTIFDRLVDCRDTYKPLKEQRRASTHD
jgi:PRTRC genetic system protein A